MQLPSKYIQWAIDKPEWQDTVRILENKIETQQSEPPQADIQFGYVYLMKSGRYYKLGRSSYVEKRNYEIGLKLPEKLKVIHKIKTDDPSGIEAYWHNRFQEKRKRGEWFELSSNDVKAFKRWKIA
jgi:hypothetical protein